MNVLDSDPRKIHVHIKSSVQFLGNCRPLVSGSQIKDSLRVLTPLKAIRAASPLLRLVP